MKKGYKTMTIEEIKEKAEYKVNIHMNKSLVEYECRKRNIKTSRNYKKMRELLIASYIDEWSKDN